jgi:hypothetical protein
VPRLKLVLNTPRGAQMALALIGRTGDVTTGTTTIGITRLSNGGPGTVTIDDPSRFSRMTAALVNADGRTTGRFSQSLQDWEWKGDRHKVSARLSTDFTPPSLRKRGASGRRAVQAQFSERMINVGTRTVLLIGPGGRKVKASVKLTSGRKLKIVPRKRLHRGTRYSVRLSRDVADLGGNVLPAGARTWSFRAH